MNIQNFLSKKNDGIPISMVTCYDSWSAALIAETDIDCVLVGDSLAMVMYGHDSTIPVNVPTMAAHTAAVRRGMPEKFIIGDLPFLSYRKGFEIAMENVGTIMSAGANAIKLEGAAGNVELIGHIVESGVPVMGHLGLTPQSVHQLGGFKVQGRGEKAAEKLRAQALELQDAGCFALVLEAVPADVAGTITCALTIPTIGIGAGPDVDGQVLVLQDLLDLNTTFKPKFVRTWMDGSTLIRDALQAYHHDVTSGHFPNGRESYR